MVNGIESFRHYFKDYEDQYIIIGGTACDLLMTSYGLDSRATKDIDLVLIIEALTSDFGNQLWKYINEARYEHMDKSTNIPQFYRFCKPKSRDYPAMLEIFSRRMDGISFPDDAILSPIPLGKEISSLSAIILDDDYYQFLKEGKIVVNDITVLDAAYLIPFKAKAWLDLNERKLNGEPVDSKDIKKHKNDIYRLSQIVSNNASIAVASNIYRDITQFLELIKYDSVDLKQMNILESKESIIDRLSKIY